MGSLPVKGHELDCTLCLYTAALRTGVCKRRNVKGLHRSNIFSIAYNGDAAAEIREHVHTC